MVQSFENEMWQYKIEMTTVLGMCSKQTSERIQNIRISGYISNFFCQLKNKNKKQNHSSNLNIDPKWALYYCLPYNHSNNELYCYMCLYESMCVKISLKKFYSKILENVHEWMEKRSFVF